MKSAFSLVSFYLVCGTRYQQRWLLKLSGTIERQQNPTERGFSKIKPRATAIPPPIYLHCNLSGRASGLPSGINMSVQVWFVRNEIEGFLSCLQSQWNISLQMRRQCPKVLSLHWQELLSREQGLLGKLTPVEILDDAWQVIFWFIDQVS